MNENIKFIENPRKPIKGSTGLPTQLPGCATTVVSIASATGGIAAGNIISTDN